MAKEFGEGAGQFEVIIENPGKIYATLREDMITGQGYRNITDLMKHRGIGSGRYSVSETALKTPVLDREETEMIIETEMGPYCTIYSDIMLSEEALAVPPHGFFSRQKKGEIRQHLAAQGIPATWDEKFRDLQVKRLDEVVIDINFGYRSPNERVQTLETRHQNRLSRLQRLTDLDAPTMILRHEEQMVKEAESELQQQIEHPTNDIVRLRLGDIWKKRGGKGGTAISFRKPEVFVENLRFYAKVYESLIRALHQVAGQSEPTSPIIFSTSSVKRATI